jgi:hypothetical protein
MSYSDSSELLNKQAELKALELKYNRYIIQYPGNTSAPTGATNAPANTNAISTTNPPPGIRPGEDFGEYWKHVSTGAANADACWTSASRDPRLFKQVVYTGDGTATATATNGGNTAWNKQCYGLVWNAPPDAAYTTNAPGYTTLKGYTKTGVSESTPNTLNEASQIAELKTRIDSLVEEIGLIASSSIRRELTQLSETSSDQKTVIQKINQYMNTSALEIDGSNNIIGQRKNLNNVYEEINRQTTLMSRKYRFIFYFIVGIVIIISYMSYVSKLTLMEQLTELSNYVSWGWWTNWGVITFVVVLLILSSFGWDMKGNISMVIRYITDPDFWTGQMWWVGVTFLLLIVIFLHATFKSFFAPAMASLEKLGEDSE